MDKMTIQKRGSDGKGVNRGWVLHQDKGFTLVELLIAITVLAIVATSFLALFVALVNSGLVAKRKAVASSLATNQIEYLKSLPYDSLAIAGGSIYTTNPLPETETNDVNGFTYTTRTSINYVDDAFDGCATYPTQELKEQLCRNYPPPASQTANDTNPADYKIIHVSVENSGGNVFASADTQVAARVAETSSTTGALIINVVDGNGNPVQDADVSVINTTISPSLSVGDSTDANGIAIFYNLPPDTNGFDYRITTTKNGYSSLSTIAPSGSLQPNYTSQKIFTQASSYLTMTIFPQGSKSLVIESQDLSGTPISGLKIYAKGGYKKYTADTNTEYYFDNISPSDTRPTTDVGGLTSISDLVPGPYYFCGSTGSTSCTKSSTTHYLVAAVPYSGTSLYNPISVPTYDSAAPPSTVFPYNGDDFYQKVRLLFSTSSSFPRISTFSVSEISLASSDLANITFQINGSNLPCDSSPASCGTTVIIRQGASNYTASCTGTSAGTNISCTVNLSGISAGSTQLSVSSGGNTYTSPADLTLGSINVVP